MPAPGAVGAGTTYRDANRVFAALANAVRREVLRLLRDGGPWADHFAICVTAGPGLTASPSA